MLAAGSGSCEPARGLSALRTSSNARTSRSRGVSNSGALLFEVLEVALVLNPAGRFIEEPREIDGAERSLSAPPRFRVRLVLHDGCLAQVDDEIVRRRAPEPG